MKTMLRIQFHGMEASTAVEERVRDYVARLEKIAAGLLSCRVMVSLEQKHQHQGRPYSVRIDLTIAGQELVVNKVQDEDVYIALRDAFLAMRSRLEEFTAQRSGASREHMRGKSVRRML